MKFDKQFFTHELKSSLEFLQRSTRSLAEEDSSFSPKPGQMTVAQQLAHIGFTVHWLIDGAFSPTGFDMDFEKHGKQTAAIKSLKEAHRIVESAYASALEQIQSRSDGEWETQIVAGPVMGGEPRFSALLAVIEHSAHHRGALSVYTRLLGKVPPMPYMDM